MLTACSRELSFSFDAKILAVKSLIRNIETNKILQGFTNKVAASRIQRSWKTFKTFCRLKSMEATLDSFQNNIPYQEDIPISEIQPEAPVELL